jgi:ribose transport system permease protein
MTLESSPIEHRRGERLKAVLLRQDVLLLMVFVAMIAFFSIINPRYFSAAAAANILQDFSPVVLMAIGLSFVIISGGIDLSVGSTLGLSGVVTALIMRQLSASGTEPALTILAGLVGGVVIGVVVGLANGFLITYAKLAPFIATLATMGAAAGVTLVITGGVQIAGAPKEVILIGNTAYFGFLTVPVAIAIVIAVIAWVFLSRTRFGRWTYAIGSNTFAARAAGINVRRHLIKMYVISGALAALAGAFLYFRLGSGSPLSGRGGELNAIAAAVVGGIALTGGVGRLSGAIVGSLIITAVLSGLIIIGVEPNWQQVVIGVLIAAAVAIQGLGSFKRREI